MSLLTYFPVFRRIPKQRPASTMRVRVTIERMQGNVITSDITATGDNIEDALLKALSKSKNMSRELVTALAAIRQPGREE